MAQVEQGSDRYQELFGQLPELFESALPPYDAYVVGLANPDIHPDNINEEFGISEAIGSRGVLQRQAVRDLQQGTRHMLRHMATRLDFGEDAGLASAGVLSLASLAEGVPWIGLVLALTFGAYGLLRKVAPVDGLVGASIESLLLVPVAVGYLLWLAAAGEGAMGHEGARIDLLLVTAGLVTALPLLWFANAARRLPLRTLGFMQYIVPTMQLALAVLVFDEPFTDLHLRGFGLIWLGVAVFTLESWWQATRRR